MRNWFERSVMVTALFGAMLAHAAEPKLPVSMRKVVLEPADSGYRWKVTEVPLPVPSDHQVLVRMHAIGLNHGEVSGLKPRGADRTGHVPASDGAGEVVAVGKLVKDVRVGTRVVAMYFANWADGPYARTMLEGSHGWKADGLLADYVVLSPAAVAPIPEGWTYEQAATLPTAGLTAWNAITRLGGVTQGDVVLVQGTGGVSTFALQFAVASGARVIVTSSSDEKLQRAKALGAEAGINYKLTPGWSDKVLQLTEGHGADVIVDIGGKSTLEESTKSLADEGRLAIVGGMTGYDGSISAWGLLEKSAQTHGVFVGSRAEYMQMREFMTRRQLRPVIERVYPFAQYPEAMELLASGNFVGKIVLRM
ncbi:MAG: NAD(P)-dependent alcohol dehydrogenase [Steroidobacter sp.]